MSGAGSSPERRQSRGSIYRRLYDSPQALTKAALAQSLGLSLPTIYQNINELIADGLICYSGEQQSTGGRRAKALSIVNDARVAIGISITENRIRFVISDLRLNELGYRKVSVSLIHQAEQFSLLLGNELERFIDDFKVDREKLLGVGIAIPAVISADRSELILAPTLGMHGTPIQEIVGHIPYPIFIENDGSCGGRAEWFIRGGRSNMAYLSLENGVGGAVLIGGAPYVGDHNRSGEFGHMCVEPAGLICKCGKRGCLEAYCSAKRISDALGISLKDFFDGVALHVPEYELLWFDLLRHLAVGINNIRMALDCDVVLGGFLTEYLPPYMSQLQGYIAANNTFDSNTDFLQLSVLRRHTVPLGAALHFVQDFIDGV